MSDSSDGGGGNSNIDKLTPSWLTVPSPRTLLDRTTKFVLTAAHGNSRSLIPTTEDDLVDQFRETSIGEWDDEEKDVASEDKEEEATEEVVEEVKQERTMLVPEFEVLEGKWNAYDIAGSSDENDDYRLDTPSGTVRLVRMSDSELRRRKALVPPRRRTAAAAAAGILNGPRVENETAVVARSRGRKAFISMPPRVLTRLFEYLPIPEMLMLLNSCRLLRRVMHKHGPAGSMAAQEEGMAGSAIYTPAGMRVWRTMLQRMGWRTWQECARGRERRQRIAIPKSHGRLLKDLCGVEEERELAAILASEPDLLFKAYFDNLSSDYIGFRSMNQTTPPFLFCEADQKTMRTSEELAVRLDQLLWFGRGRYTQDADAINQRLAVAIDQFERVYRERFKAAFVEGDSQQMRMYARIMEGIRDGRGCIRIVVQAHPLLSISSDTVLEPRYSKVLSASSLVRDTLSFGTFLDGLDELVLEHARVVALAFPPPTLPATALYCFIQELFGTDGLALSTLERLYEHLRSIPVAGNELVSLSPQLPSEAAAAVPNEAAKDVHYLTTVADVVARLLLTVKQWASMAPVAVPEELGRRCVFSAFDEAIGDYVQLERRIIDRAYKEELDQWMAKPKGDAGVPQPSGNSRDSMASVRTHSGGGGGSGASEQPIRLVNFRQRVEQMEEYKLRILRVLERKLDINLSTGSSREAEPKEPARQRRRSSAGAALKRTVVGELLRNSPVSIDLCLNMVLTNREAIDRLSVFAEAPPDMRLCKLAQEAIESVFCILLQSIGNHIRPAFARIVAELRELEHAAMVAIGPQEQPNRGDGAGDHASAAHVVYSAQRAQAEQELRERFTSAELRFFELIHLSDLAVQMLEIYHKRDMCGFIDEADFLNICNQEKKALERTVDDSVADGMDCVIEIMLRQAQHILETEQRDSDYHPASNVSLTLTPTLACARAVQLLGESSAALQSMAGQKQMREVFLGEVGVRLFNVLLENIRRFRITEPGGFQLIADLNLYYEWAESVVDADTLRYFAALKDLANCFILAPRDLRGFLQEQYSRRTFDGVMRSEEVYDVVACRADYREIRSQVEGHCDFM